MSLVPLIAIVDDDPDVRRSLDSLLRSAGMTSVTFGNGTELLATLAPERISCIVTDLHMPHMTGLELQVELARIGWRQPVVVMTAYATDTARDQALAAGATAFLTKPIDPEHFLDTIGALI